MVQVVLSFLEQSSIKFSSRVSSCNDGRVSVGEHTKTIKGRQGTKSTLRWVLAGKYMIYNTIILYKLYGLKYHR